MLQGKKNVQTKLAVLAATFILLNAIGYYFILSPIIWADDVPAAVMARNARRISDMRSLKEALAAYFADHDAYPQAPTGNCDQQPYNNLNGLANFLVPGYMKDIPKDPNPANCVYDYFYFSDKKRYVILIRLEAIDPTVYHDRWCIGANSGDGLFRESDGYLPCP